MTFVLAGQWAWETGLYVDGGAAVRTLWERHVVKLAGTTKKQDGHPYLKILPGWFEECCFPVMYSLYSLTSKFSNSSVRTSSFFRSNPDGPSNCGPDPNGLASLPLSMVLGMTSNRKSSVVYATPHGKTTHATTMKNAHVLNPLRWSTHTAAVLRMLARYMEESGKSRQDTRSLTGR